MDEHPLRVVIAAADDAISREELDAVAKFYGDDAILVVMPGKIARGKAEIRKAFDAIAAHFNHSVHVSLGEMTILEAGDPRSCSRTRASEQTMEPMPHMPPPGELLTFSSASPTASGAVSSTTRTARTSFPRTPTAETHCG